MWEQIRSNRRKSILLIVCLALVLVVLGLVIAEAVQRGAGLIGIGIAFLVWAVMCLVAYFQGDNILLAVSGAKEISKEDHPQLYNVVEEITIAAGLPKMPRIFIINDMALNAFAVGRNPNKAAIAVTAGLLAKLNRDQLQGVIAHEISHIINRDVLLMTIAGITLGAIVMIAHVFLRSMFYTGAGRRSRRYSTSTKGGGQAQIIMLVVAIVLAILAPIIAQLIYLAISRRREYLADANAAVLTRYPEGLASALEALARDTHELAGANKATAPMYIINPFHAARKAVSLGSTHPPINARIKILRSIGGNVSYQQYDEAFRAVSQKKTGVMPQSALSDDKAAAVRAPGAGAAPKSPRQQMREAGDLMRKVNKFLFLPCVCGLRIKLPPDFKHDKVKCPRCSRVLAVPVAQMAVAAQVADVLSDRKGPPPVRKAKPRRPKDPNGR